MTPTVTKVRPNKIPTGGRKLVVVEGSGFQLTKAPSSSGPAPKPVASMRAFFGAEEAVDVRVLTTGLLHLVAPSHMAGTVPLTLRNVDAWGNTLADGAEQVVVPNAITYELPNLARLPSQESVLARITRLIMRELKKQVLPNVTLSVSTDYDDTPTSANVAALSELPGIALVGPMIQPNSIYSSNEPRTVKLPDGSFEEYYPALTADVAFTFVGVDDNAMRAISLMQEVANFFNRNTVLRLTRVPDRPETGFVEYELEVEQDGWPKWNAVTGNSNLRAFAGSFVFRGVDIDEDDMVAARGVSVQDTDVGLSPSPVILAGTPGVATAAPIPPGPPLGLGTDGPLVQFYPPTENED